MSVGKKASRWGKKKPQEVVPPEPTRSTSSNNPMATGYSAKSSVRDAKKNACKHASVLFSPASAVSVIHSGNRKEIAATLSATDVSRTPDMRILERDLALLEQGHALCWNAAICSQNDYTLFDKLFEELKPWKASPYKRSRHTACITEALLHESPTYLHVKKWAGGNRVEGADEKDHHCTIGVSFGGDRDLRFKHLKTEFEFSFPQGNGDVFAFTSAVNSQFQHAIPQVLPKHRASPRISLIFWGHVPNESLQTH
eukprot:gene66-539_t